MVSAAQVMAGAAFVKVGADITDMQKGLKAAAKTFTGFIGRVGVAMQALGGSMLIPLYNSIKAYADYGNAVYDIAERTGVAHQSVAELGFATEAMGGSMDYFAKGMRFLQRNFAVAADGSKSMKKAFTDIGLTIDDLKKKSPEELFMDTADAIGNINNESKMVQSAIKIFGRGGSNLVEIFQLGKDGIEDFRKAYRYLHGELKADDAKEVEVRFKSLKMVWQGLQDTIANQLIPQFRKFTDMLIRAGVRIRMLLNDNPKLITQFAKMGITLVKIGTAFVAISAAITLIFFPIIPLLGVISVAIVSVYETLMGTKDGINSLFKFFYEKITLFGSSLKTWTLWIKEIFRSAFTDVKDFLNWATREVMIGFAAIFAEAERALVGGKNRDKIYKQRQDAIKGMFKAQETLTKEEAEKSAAAAKAAWDAITKSMVSDTGNQSFTGWIGGEFKKIKDFWAEIKGDKPFDPKGEMAFKNMIARLTEAKKKLDTSLKSSEIKFGGSTVLTGGGSMMGQVASGNTVAARQLEEARLQSEYLRDIRDAMDGATGVEGYA